MPCFSASNLRFVGANAPSFGAKERAKTAFRNNSISKPNLRWDCDNFLNVQGYVAQDQKKQNDRKGAFRRGVKAQQTMLPAKELARLKTASKVVSLEDRLDALLKQEQETKRLEKEAYETRQRFKAMDDARQRAADACVEKEDLFGAGEKLKVLERAFLAKHEQEEEVKRVNRIILNAKCHAVRDAQIQEKFELEKELKNENIRLEKLVLERAIKSLSEEDEKYEKQKEEKLKYAREIKQQLNERENLRFLEAERVEEEAKMLQKAKEALKRDDERLAKLDRERRQKFRDELAKIAEMSNLFKKMLYEQERKSEMRVAAYMREKEQRERALKIERKLAKEEFERKQQRLFTLAQKITESKSQREETGYLREQERIERDYRRKEKEAVLRKRQIERDLAEARDRQLQEAKHRQAMQIARGEQDFKNLVDSLKKEEAKEKQLAEQRECRSKCYRDDIIRQMSDKEIERRRLLELEKSEALRSRDTERQRESNIRNVINAKLGAMREACLPEKYIKDVEKQLQKIATQRVPSKQYQ